jgi:hypothetical protein
VTTENAKLREEIPGRSYANIGTSSDDLDSSVSEFVGQDKASVTLPAPVMESFAASLTDVNALKALGLCKCSRFMIMHILLTSLSALNKARLETQRIRLEMETKSSRADNEKERLEQHLSNGESVAHGNSWYPHKQSVYLALEQLERQQHTTKAIQSLYDETNGKVDELENRLLCSTCYYSIFKLESFLISPIVLNELGESNVTRLQTERKYSKLLQQVSMTCTFGPQWRLNSLPR